MKPEDQNTLTVVERIYSQLLYAKSEKKTISYSDCFTHCFEIQYERKYCHFIQERRVVNNIPYILGAIGRTCNDHGLPPLSCLVVKKDTWKCGKHVVVSDNIPEEIRPDFAEDIDRPTVFLCNDYPQPGSQQGKIFIDCVIDHLQKRQGLINKTQGD